MENCKICGKETIRKFLGRFPICRDCINEGRKERDKKNAKIKKGLKDMPLRNQGGHISHHLKSLRSVLGSMIYE